MASIESGQRSSLPQQNIIPSSDASQASSIAFLIHSQDTLNDKLSPGAGTQPAVRQKRRRTSPGDQAILEAEYETNPKPDKASRADIVKRIALGEKEVQIWFQNRRQMTRRKSQPLSFPDLDTALFSSQESLGSSAYSSFSICEQSQQDSMFSQTDYTKTQSTEALAEDNQAEKEVLQAERPSSALSEEASRANDEAPESHRQAEKTPKEGFQGQDACSTRANVANSKPAASAKQRLSTLVRSLSSPFDIPQDQPSGSPSSVALADASAVGKTDKPASASTLRRTQSLIRLSTSLEGKAEVAIGNSPSPPKLRAPRPSNGLQRSQSAIAPNEPTANKMFPDVIPQTSSMPGRSRDARTWEFYCDSSARDALTEQAEREQSGSAVGAIGLIRSRSNRALASNPNKRNARPEKRESIKRLKAEDKQARKRKLSRTQSSVARLQTVNGSPRETAANRSEKPRKPGSHLEADHDGDSDKENWEPGTQSRTERTRPNTQQTSSSRSAPSILKESLKIPSQSSSLDTLMNRTEYVPRGLQIKSAVASDAQKHADEHLVEEGDETPRELDELDCVQNLLSLSQGNWH